MICPALILGEVREFSGFFPFLALAYADGVTPSRACGLKPYQFAFFRKLFACHALAGVWIETSLYAICPSEADTVTPSRACGLKLATVH